VPLPVGTVTSDTVGRISWMNGNREYRGRRGTIRRTIARFVDAAVP
jgi:hypothetical protein